MDNADDSIAARTFGYHNLSVLAPVAAQTKYEPEHVTTQLEL